MSTSTPPPPGPAPEPASMPVVQLPPGMPQSPAVVWAVSTASTAAIEAADFGFINPGVAQKIVALIGLIGPVVVTIADAIIRHGQARSRGTQ